MVLKQVKQLNTFDAIHLYHDAFGKQMLRNAKGRWCAPKSRKKHHGDASVKLHDAVTRLKLDTCPAFDIGGENQFSIYWQFTPYSLFREMISL